MRPSRRASPDLGGTQALKEHITGLKAIRDQADSERAQVMSESSGQQTITTMVREFARTCPRAAQARWRRQSPRSPMGAGPVGRGADGEVRFMGVEGRPAQDRCHRLGSEIGGRRRSQFCSEVAEREGFEPSVRF
ncbi:MAG: hypothetical protein ACYDDA_05610 [Acidiferrobacteraceae bacterium]